jgi:hypothetical protein
VDGAAHGHIEQLACTLSPVRISKAIIFWLALQLNPEDSEFSLVYEMHFLLVSMFELDQLCSEKP